MKQKNPPAKSAKVLSWQKKYFFVDMFWLWIPMSMREKSEHFGFLCLEKGSLITFPCCFWKGKCLPLFALRAHSGITGGRVILLWPAGRVLFCKILSPAFEHSNLKLHLNLSAAATWLKMSDPKIFIILNMTVPQFWGLEMASQFWAARTSPPPRCRTYDNT